MKVNCDILRYFLSKHQWKTHFFHYDSTITTDLIRHYAGDCPQEHTLLILDWTTGSCSETRDIPDANVLPGHNYIFLCVLPPSHYNRDHSHWIAAIHCPVICVYTDQTAALFNEIQDIFEKIQAHRQTLEQLSIHSYSYQALIDCCDDLLEEPVSLIDHTFTYVAYSKEKSEQKGYVRDRVENGRLSSQVAAQLMSTPGFESLTEKTGVFEFEDDYSFMGRNIFYENVYRGRLVTASTQDFILNCYQKYLLECLGGFVEKMYHRIGSFSFQRETPLLLHALLPEALSGESIKNSDWRNALEQKGWNNTDYYLLMSFQAAYRFEKKIHPDYLCPQLESRWPWVAATTYDGEAVVLINWSRVPADFEQQLAYFVRDNLLTAGISRSFKEAAGLPAAWRQTKIAVEMGLRLHPHLWYYFFDHYVLDYLREQSFLELPPEALRHPALTLLSEYDEQHGTQLSQSLFTLMDSRYNMSAASERMFVHRTTFIKRIQQIQKLTGLDLTDWDTRLYLMLSYGWMG